MCQKDRVLNHLKSGKTITPMEALIEYGTMSLQYHIYKLREEGYDIRTTMRQSLNKKRFAEYKMLHHTY